MASVVRAELIQGSAPLPAEAVRVGGVHGPHGVNFASSAISARCAVCVKGFVFLNEAAGWLLVLLIRLSVIPLRSRLTPRPRCRRSPTEEGWGAKPHANNLPRCFLLASNLTTRASVLGQVQLPAYCRYTSRAFRFSHLLHSSLHHHLPCKCQIPHTVADDLRRMSVFNAGSSPSKH